jgi:flagellar hook-associated protein 2
MASISSAGIGSGLDVNGIITQLMTIERQPLRALETQETQLNSKVSNFGKLQSLLSGLRDKAGSISSLTLWNQRSGSTADTRAVEVTTAPGAALGSYAVEVQQLAAAQTLSSRAFTAADTAAQFSGGTITIELGEWTGSPTIGGFDPKAGATPVTITFDPADDTLAEVRDRINGAGAGVTATIINDASGARLALRSSATGAENGFRITATETTDDGVAANGLSALAYSALAASPMTLNQRAFNALATINGIDVESTSNTLTNVSDGVSLRLLAQTTGPVEVGVSTDTEAVKTAVEDFVKSFNELATFIKDQTKYDEASKKAGAMQGDSLVVGLQRQMRNVINEATTASTTFTRLADVGITMGADGNLSINESSLANGLANLEQFRNMMQGDGATTADKGFMRRFKEMGDLLLAADGSFEGRTESLQARIDRINDRQEQMEARLVSTEKRLRAQYEALDRNMGQLSGLSSYMSQQLQALNNFYTARSGG